MTDIKWKRVDMAVQCDECKQPFMFSFAFDAKTRQLWIPDSHYDCPHCGAFYERAGTDVPDVLDQLIDGKPGPWCVQFVRNN